MNIQPGCVASASQDKRRAPAPGRSCRTFQRRLQRMAALLKFSGSDDCVCDNQPTCAPPVIRIGEAILRVNQP